MTNRIVLGERSPTEIGAFISRPGVDVLTAADKDLLLSTKYSTLQVMQQGYVTLPGSAYSVSITVPNFGYRPIVIYNAEDFGIMTSLLVGYTDATTLTFYSVSRSQISIVRKRQDEVQLIKYTIFRKELPVDL